MKALDPSIEFGDFLKTRFLGERMRDDIIALLEEVQEIKIDFSQVSGMAPSFADECFGDLFADCGPEFFRERLHLVEANDSVKSVLRMVFTERQRHLA